MDNFAATWTRQTGNTGFAPRTGIGLVTDSSKLFIVGGSDADQGFSDVWSSSDAVSWTMQTDDAGFGERAGHLVLAARNPTRLFVLGGVNRTSGTAVELLNDVWMSGDGGRDWSASTLSAKWSRRYGHFGVVFLDRLWVFGGLDPVAQQDVWFSSVSSNGSVWSQPSVPTAPWSPRAYSATAVFNGRVWVCGGSDLSRSYSDVWSSADPSSNAWTRQSGSVGHTPPSQAGARLLEINSELWLFFGLQTGASPSVWVMNGDETWSEVASRVDWGPRDRMGAVAMGRRAIIVGGVRYDNDGKPIYQNDAWMSTDNLLCERAGLVCNGHGVCEVKVGGSVQWPPVHASVASRTSTSSSSSSNHVSTTLVNVSVGDAALGAAVAGDSVAAEFLRLGVTVEGGREVGGLEVYCLCDSGYIQDGKCNETVCGPHNCKKGHCIGPSPSPAPEPAPYYTLPEIVALRPVPTCPNDAGLWGRAMRGDGAAIAELGAGDRCECYVGWEDPTCSTPICKSGCLHGSCKEPGECNCFQGWRGELCTIKETIFEDAGQFVARNQVPLFTSILAFGATAVCFSGGLLNYVYRPGGPIPLVSSFITTNIPQTTSTSSSSSTKKNKPSSSSSSSKKHRRKSRRSSNASSTSSFSGIDEPTPSSTLATAPRTGRYQENQRRLSRSSIDESARRLF